MRRSTNPASMVALIAACTVAYMGCAKGIVNGDGALVAAVVVTPPSATVSVNGSRQLSATTVDESGVVLTGRTITWETSAPNAATVDNSGLVRGVGAGQAIITARSEDRSGTAAIVVQVPSVASVDVSPPSSAVYTGNTVQLTATTRDASGAPLSGRTITWATSSAGTATVNGAGVVTGVAAGQVTITATSEGMSGSGVVTVTTAPPPPPVPVATVAVTPTPSTLTVGSTVQLSATTRDANGATLTGRVVSWSSSNTGYATVSANGLVTGVAAGAVTITATSEGKTGTASVTVNAVAPPPPAPVATVAVTPSTNSIVAGSTAQLSATTRDANGAVLTGRTVSWSSSNTAFATVSANGLVSGIAAGAVTITATSEGKSGTASVTVTAPPPVPVATVAVTPSTNSIPVGSTVQLSAATRDANGATLTGRVVTWSSSNTAFATVSGSGLVSGVAAGSVTITATSEGKTGTAGVTVTAVAPPPPVPVATVAVTPATNSLTAGSSVQLTATTRDASGATLTGRVITWSSSNTSLATVSSSGKVSALAAGAVTITALSEGKSGTASVTIAAAPPPPPADSPDPLLQSCPAPNVMAHGFDDGTLGPFTDNFNAYGKIIRDPTAKGGYSAQQQWFLTPGQEQRSGVEASFPATTRIYVRWAYKEDATFDNGGIKKVILFRAPGFGAGSGILTVYQGRFNFDFLNDMTNHPWGVYTNVGTEVRPDALRGQWHWFEMMNDITTSGALKMKFWVDGVLKMDYTEPLSNGGLTMGGLMVNDTFNAPVTNAFDWTDEIAISTQCIGAPW